MISLRRLGLSGADDLPHQACVGTPENIGHLFVGQAALARQIQDVEDFLEIDRLLAPAVGRPFRRVIMRTR